MYEPDEIPKAKEVTFFGHPFGLSTLFFTELWERFSYYGMRALLVLYMTAAIAETNGGLGMEVDTATAIYGLYTFAVYALALPGGWVADRLLGQRKTVLVGGIIIALGHYTLAIDMIEAFYAGLILVVIGTGLLKPNVSAIVAELYPEGGARRDAGFSIFYMGINVGAMTGPLLCSYLGEEINWHLGFGAAGVGMTLGLIWYVWGARFLGDAGKLKEDGNSAAERAAAWRMFFFGIGFVALIVYVLYGLSSGDLFPFAYLSADGAPLLEFGIVEFAESTGAIIVVLAIVYFGYTIIFACRDSLERKRVGLIAVLFFGAAMFWSGFEQAGSSMTLFTEEHTDRVFFGIEQPTGWFQAINPLFIIILAPVMGSVWVWLGAQSVAGRQVRPRSDPARDRISRHGLGGVLHRGGKGLSHVARGDLFPPHRGRALPEPRRPERHHQALAQAARGADDGHLVHGRGARQPDRRARGGLYRKPAHGRTLHRGGRCRRRLRTRVLPLFQADPQSGGRRKIGKSNGRAGPSFGRRP